MRKLIGCVVAVLGFSLVANAQVLVTRTATHEMRIERTATPAEITYAVRVTSLEGGASLLATTVTGTPGQAVDATGSFAGEDIRVHLSYTPNFFSATLDVVKGDILVDNCRTWWQLEPRSRASVPVAAEHLVAPGAYRVGGDVKAPVVVKRVDPVYPEEARRARVSGIVILEVLIGTDGLVKDAMILKPLPFGLDQAALDAVRQWEFKPGTLNGQPVPVLFNLTTNFKLDSPPPPPPPGVVH